MYTVYGSPYSLFTRKLQAALNFYGASYQFRLKRGSGHEQEIETRAGTHQMPVLQTPENWMIADTTPVLGLLDARFPGRRLFPAGLAGLLVHMVEEYFDEWIARVMVHYRWHYPESARVVAGQIANGDPEVANSIRQWGPKACRATGTELPEHQKAAEEEYRGLLTAMESQLAETGFLLGDRPTAVDCAVLGGLYAHILNDPDPKKIMPGFPRVVDWARARQGEWDGDGAEVEFAAITPFARHVLEQMRHHYRPVLLGNSKAVRAGQKSFVVESFGTDASYLARPYPERSRAMVVERIVHTLGREDVEVAENWLETLGLAECFAPSRCQFLLV